MLRFEFDQGRRWYHVASLYFKPRLRPMLTEMYQVGPESEEGQRLLKALRPRPWKCVEEMLVDLVGVGGRDWVLSLWRLVGVGASGAPGGASPVGDIVVAQRLPQFDRVLEEGARRGKAADGSWPSPVAGGSRSSTAGGQVAGSRGTGGSARSPGEHVCRDWIEDGRRQPRSRVDRAPARAVHEAEQPGSYRFRVPCG